jgi:hypothetical protein
MIASKKKNMQIYIHTKIKIKKNKKKHAHTSILDIALGAMIPSSKQLLTHPPPLHTTRLGQFFLAHRCEL